MHQNNVHISTEVGKLLIVIGLPGSGKTTYIQSFVKDNPEYSVYDDYQGETYNHDSDPRLSKHFGSLVSTLKQAKSAVVSDIRYCVSYELNLFLAAILSSAPDTRIEFIYFENNPELCKQNVYARAREGRIERELELIDQLSPIYSPIVVGALPVHS